MNVEGNFGVLVCEDNLGEFSFVLRHVNKESLSFRNVFTCRFANSICDCVALLYRLTEEDVFLFSQLAKFLCLFAEVGTAVANLAQRLYFVGKAMADHWEEALPVSNRGRRKMRTTSPPTSDFDEDSDDADEDDDVEDDEEEARKARKRKASPKNKKKEKERAKKKIKTEAVMAAARQEFAELKALQSSSLTGVATGKTMP